MKLRFLVVMGNSHSNKLKKYNPKGRSLSVSLPEEISSSCVNIAVDRVYKQEFTFAKTLRTHKTEESAMANKVLEEHEKREALIASASLKIRGLKGNNNSLVKVDIQPTSKDTTLEEMKESESEENVKVEIQLKEVPKTLSDFLTPEELELLFEPLTKFQSKSSDRLMCELLTCGQEHLIMEFLEARLKLCLQLKGEEALNDIFPTLLSFCYISKVEYVSRDNLIGISLKLAENWVNVAKEEANSKEMRASIESPVKLKDNDDSPPNHEILSVMACIGIAHGTNFFELFNENLSDSTGDFLKQFQTDVPLLGFEPCCRKVLNQKIETFFEQFVQSPAFYLTGERIFHPMMHAYLTHIVTQNKDRQFDRICQLLEDEISKFSLDNHKQRREQIKSLLTYVADRQYMYGLSKMMETFNFNLETDFAEIRAGHKTHRFIHKFIPA